MRLEILGDQEEAGSAGAGVDELSEIHAAVNDHALHRRLDRRISEIDVGFFLIGLCQRQRALRDDEGGFRGIRVSNRGIALGSGDGSTLRQALHAVEFPSGLRDFDLGRFDVSFGLGDIRLGLVHAGHEQLVIQSQQRRSRLDMGAVTDRLRRVVGIGRKRENFARNLGADVDHFVWFERPGGIDRGEEVAAADASRAEIDRTRAQFGVIPNARRAAGPREKDHE